MSNVMIYLVNDELCAINTADQSIFLNKFSSIVEDLSTTIILYDGVLYPQNIPKERASEVRNFLESLNRQWFISFKVDPGVEQEENS